jgi:phosphoglycolate phosphatase
MAVPQLVLWDLDGTLVDSAPTIMDALQRAFTRLKVNPTEPLTEKLIGPPLDQLLQRLFPSSTDVIRAEILAEFKQHYDHESYKATRVFPTVSDTLLRLNQLGVRQWVCTNKRLLPTHRIVDHLGWREVFEHLYALPDFRVDGQPVASKSDMVQSLMMQHRLNPGAIILVGDTTTDQLAAHNNQLGFAYARWGYGQVTCASPDLVLNVCEEFLTYF